MNRYFAPLLLTLVCFPAVAQEVEHPLVTKTLEQLREMGGSYERAVVRVSAPRTFTDEHISRLGTLHRHLHGLDLYNTAITDNGLREIHVFTELRELDLRATRVTDAVVEHLAKAPQLRQLWLSNTAVTGARFNELSGMKELSQLVLSESKVSREGMKQLKALPALKILVLSDTAVDNAGVAELKDLTPLVELDLRRSKIAGSGGMDATWAKSLPKLSALLLSETQVDDRCIAALASLPRLEVLTIARTRITPAGLCRFAQLRRRKELEALPFWLIVSPEQITEDVSAELSKTFEEVKYEMIEDAR